jgi:hypothetical protein
MSLSIPNKYVVPFYSTSINYPPGYKVQDVFLTGITGLINDTGLKLGLMNLSITSSIDPLEFTSGGISSNDWYPNEYFTWDFKENANGSSILTIDVYPFFYNPDTTDVKFYKKFEFDIDYIHSEIELSEVSTDKNEYALGEIIELDMEMLNTGNTTQEVFLSAVIESYVSFSHLTGLPVMGLEMPSGITSVSLTLDMLNDPEFPDLSNGLYSIKVELKKADGTLLDSATVRIIIGISRCEITEFSATPELFKIGDLVSFSLTFKNTGSMDINGTGTFEVFNSEGDKITEFNQTITELEPGDNMTIEAIWDTTGITKDNYYVKGEISYYSYYEIAQAIEVKDLSTSISDVIETIENLDLQKGIENSLVSKLDNAIKSIDKGNYKAAENQLKAFIKEVKALSGKKLTMEDSNELIGLVDVVIAGL